MKKSYTKLFTGMGIIFLFIIAFIFCVNNFPYMFEW